MVRSSLLIVLVALLPACGDSSPNTMPTPTASATSTGTPTPSPSPTPAADPAALLMENRALWNHVGAIRYRMIERVTCYCLFDHPHLVAIEVLNGQIVVIRDVWTGAEVINPTQGAYRTVDEIFDLLEEAISSQADRIAVEYSPFVGAPIDAYVDYDLTLADEEMGFSISEMIILNSSPQ